MYDPDWPYGHTYHGGACRVLATDIRRENGTYELAIAYVANTGIEYLAIARHVDLIPIPAPKKRIQGWLNIYPGPEDGGYHYHSSVFKNKEDANYSSNKHRIACISIDVEEGEGLT